MTTSLRDEIRDELENYIHSGYSVAPCLDEILKLIEKRIDEIERSYWKTLTPYLKKLPMKDTFPKEIDALNKVRTEIKR